MLPDVVREVCSTTENHVLIEPYLSGREFCVAAGGPVLARKGRLSRRNGPFVFAELERVLETGEKIFTSMDLRPISSSRIRPLDPIADAWELSELRALARDVFLEFDLNSLVRLDVRSDGNGRLMVLEANPKPDLKRPNGQVTSLVCAGLDEHGMDYDDLILSMLANCLHVYVDQKRGSVAKLLELLA